MNVVIIGGGWAGLSAAVMLSHGGASVTVLESARQLGGRARAVPFNKHHVDNGQHIMLGAYTSMLRVLEIIGIPEHEVLRRRPLRLEYILKNRRLVRLKAGALPAPLHLLSALLRFRVLNPAERLGVIRALLSMRHKHFHVHPDIDLLDYLKRLRQNENTRHHLWEPLCLAVMNTPMENASTRLFLNVIRDAFFRDRGHSDILLPVRDLRACLPQPAMDFIERRGGHVHLGARVHGIHVRNGRAVSVQTRNGELEADHIVIATPPEACRRLLTRHGPCKEINDRLRQLPSMPLTTLYLQYPEGLSLGRDFVGFVDRTIQWLFDRGRLSGEKGVMAAVISGPGAHLDMEAWALTELVTREIGEAFPHWPQPTGAKLIREKRATLVAYPGIDDFRPQTRTPVEGLWLAGDYTATGYPSTLEGAVRSGIHCAETILSGT